MAAAKYWVRMDSFHIQTRRESNTEWFSEWTTQFHVTTKCLWKEFSHVLLAILNTFWKWGNMSQRNLPEATSVAVHPIQGHLWAHWMTTWGQSLLILAEKKWRNWIQRKQKWAWRKWKMPSACYSPLREIKSPFLGGQLKSLNVCEKLSSSSLPEFVTAWMFV